MSNSTINHTNSELYEKLVRLQWLLKKQRLRTFAECGPMADPTRGQGRIFAILKMQDGISTKDLSYLLDIRVSSLNELLAKMERNGYIKREPSAADRRVMLIKLTEQGRNVKQQEWNPDDMFDCLTEEEQKIFSDYLDRIIGALEEKTEGDSGEDKQDWWIHGARERMGEELFNRFASMKGDGFGFRGGFGGFACGGFGKPERSENVSSSCDNDENKKD